MQKKFLPIMKLMTKKNQGLFEKLRSQWVAGNIPDPEELAPLTPDEAEALAYIVGYNTNWEFHIAVREGCRNKGKG